VEEKQNEAIITLQNAIRNKRAINEFSSLYFEKRIKPELIRQKEETRQKQEAIIKLQNAYRVKQAKEILSKKRIVKRALETFQISNNLQVEPIKSNTDYEKLRELKRLKETEDKSRIEQEKARIEAFKQMTPVTLTEYKKEVEPQQPSKFQIYQKKLYNNLLSN